MLLVPVVLPLSARAAVGGDGAMAANAFVQIGADSRVTVVIKHVEFGQGIATGLATMVAEELDADWAQVDIVFAENNDPLFKNLFMGTMATGGSTGVANSWAQMRHAGASARALLVEAAARRWAMPASAITVARGVVIGGEHRAAFGELVEEAALLPRPTEVKLKERAAFSLIGQPLAKVDTAGKVDGSARFATDVDLPGMVHATVLHPPIFGGQVAAFDAAAALAVPGVLAVRQVPSGIAVYARNFHAALRARQLVAVTWDESTGERRSSAELLAAAREAAARPVATPIVQTGDVDAALATGIRRIDAVYEFPFLAHAPMEPLSAVVQVRDGRLDLWMGSQFQVRDTRAVARVLGIPEDRAVLHQCLVGGSFGRRATLGQEFAVEAGHVAKAWGGAEPIKLAWTREDDLTGGFYRPLMVHRVSAAVDAAGTIVAWDHVIAGQSFVLAGPSAAAAERRGYDTNMVEGAIEPLYGVAARRLGVHVVQNGVPTSFWRSVGYSHNSYVVETMVDELLEVAGRDPVAGRLEMLADPRAAAVLREAARMAKWTGRRRGSRACGVALVKSFGTYVAQIVEVSRGDEALPRVHRVWCAVDCGIAINPDIIRAQLEGGIGFALGHALYAETALGEGGVVEQQNFDSFRSLRIGEMPRVEISILPSDASPTGIGEPGVPPLAPAVANAWRQLSGKTARRLPFCHPDNGGS